MKDKLLNVPSMVTTIFFFLATFSFAQEEEEVIKDTIAYSMEEALVSPQDIIILDLRKEKLKELPNSFNDLINLQALYLDKNKLSKLPRSLASCKQLKTISIANNKFTNFPTIICYLSKLETIDISTNEIASLPECLKELIHLQNIYMVGNEIGKIPQSFDKLDIKELDMRMIQMNENEQNAIKELFPNAEIKFSKPCNCFGEEDEEDYDDLTDEN
jgi:Leucine-rich repeat (LRR) protein